MKGLAWNRFCSRPSGDGSARPIKKRRVWTKGHHNSLVPLQRIKIALPLFEEKACHIKKRVSHTKNALSQRPLEDGLREAKVAPKWKSLAKPIPGEPACALCGALLIARAFRLVHVSGKAGE
jgi:hypothetical protein